MRQVGPARPAWREDRLAPGTLNTGPGLSEHTSERHLVVVFAMLRSRASIIWSIEKLPVRWLGGYSLARLRT